MDHNVLQKLNTFFEQFERVEFDPKKTIIRPNDELKYIYFLVEGEVRQYTNTLRGEEIILHIFSKGAYFPMMFPLADIKNTYYFESTNNMIAYKAPIAQVIDFIKGDIEVCFDLAQRFARGLSSMLIKTEHTLYQDAYYKVISILIYLARKFGKESNGNTSIEIPLSHYDIASFIGIQRETASRQLEKLVQKGIINSENHLITLDLQKLEMEENRYKHYLAKR
jgi:CRP/FNR family transcriptional regulator, anaerobic regulatory protein